MTICPPKAGFVRSALNEIELGGAVVRAPAAGLAEGVASTNILNHGGQGQKQLLHPSATLLPRLLKRQARAEGSSAAPKVRALNLRKVVDP